MSCQSGPHLRRRRGSLSPGDIPSSGWASVESRLQPLDELILVFRGAVDLAFLGPTLQPCVNFRWRDAALLRDPHDVLVVRDAFRARKLVDNVSDRDDLFSLRLADPGLDDVNVEATFLPGDLAHPVLDDPHRALRVFRADRLAQAEPSAGLGESDDRLQLARGDGDARTRGLPGLPDLQVLLFDDLHRLVRHHRVDALRIGDVLPEEVRVEMGREGFLEDRRLFHGEARLASPPDLSDLVSFEDVFRKLAIAVRLRAVDDREDDVEPAQQRGRQVDLLGDVLVLVEPAELRVRGGEDRAPGLEDGRDASLRDANPLLLHRFVDRRAVLWIHFLDFVDGGKPEIREDQGSRFGGPSSLAEFVPDRGRGQPRRRGGLPRGVDSAGREPDHVGQELALARPRISDQDEMDVPANPPPVGHELRDPTEQLQGEGFLLHVHPIDRGRDRCRDQAEDIGARTDLPDPVSVLLRHFDLFELDPFHLDRVDVHEDVEEGRALPRSSALDAPEHAVQNHALPRCDAAGQVVFHVGAQPLRLLAAPQPFRRFLNLDLLRIQVQGCLGQQFELRRTRGALAPPLFLVTLQGLAERLAVLLFLDDRPAPQALEQSPHDLGTDLRALPDQAFDRDVLAEMLRPQIPNLHSAVPREAVDPEVDLGGLFSRRHEATDRFLARHEDVQRVPQEIDRHVRVEAIQVEERGFEAPRLRIAVGHRDDLREVTHLLEELLPLRDQLILRILDEHFLPPARKRRSIGNAHISLSPPSTGPSPSREYRSDRFHWNAHVLRGLIRIASTRNSHIECSRPRAGRPPRIQDTRDGGRCRFRRMWLRGRPKRRARLRPVGQDTRSALKGGRGGVAESATGLEGPRRFLRACQLSLRDGSSRGARRPPALPWPLGCVCYPGVSHGGNRETAVRTLQRPPCARGEPARATDALRPRRDTILKRLHDGEGEHRPRVRDGPCGHVRERGTTPAGRTEARMEGADRPGDVEGERDRTVVVLLYDPGIRRVRNSRRLVGNGVTFHPEVVGLHRGIGSRRRNTTRRVR